jgi:hypothetical protein
VIVYSILLLLSIHTSLASSPAPFSVLTLGIQIRESKVCGEVIHQKTGKGSQGHPQRGLSHRFHGEGVQPHSENCCVRSNSLQFAPFPDGDKVLSRHLSHLFATPGDKDVACSTPASFKRSRNTTFVPAFQWPPYYDRQHILFEEALERQLGEILLEVSSFYLIAFFLDDTISHPVVDDFSIQSSPVSSDVLQSLYNVHLVQREVCVVFNATVLPVSCKWETSTRDYTNDPLLRKIMDATPLHMSQMWLQIDNILSKWKPE